MTSIETAIDDPFLLGLYRHWDAKRGGRPFPCWSDFDPLELRTWLGSINVVEIEPKSTRFRYRIFGQTAASLLGVELTGRYADELPPHIAGTVLADYRTLTASGEPIFKVRELGAPGSERLRVLRLLMPLSARGDALDMILSAMRVE
ncbi:MAG TPA: PAS domain-containing protein [Alphaproteobacteria bacterium]|jgi:hypothetical protein